MTSDDVAAIRDALAADNTSVIKHFNFYRKCRKSDLSPCGPSHRLAFIAGWAYAIDSGASLFQPERIARLLQALEDAQRDAERLQQICVNAHDRLLRGDDDRKLLALLASAWEAN